MARKRTAEDEWRTTPIGLFLTADAYWDGANVLYRSNKRRKRALPFGDKPSYFCYYHAIELYLKAVLRCYHSVSELETKYRHNATKLMDRATGLGVAFGDEDTEVLRLMGETDAVIRSRYTQSGFFTWPSLEALNRTCKSLRASSHDVLHKAGVPLRPIRRVRRYSKSRMLRQDGFEAG